ncbi:MAG: DUF3150 domain-containing protein [Candidatus Manganitrophaceae bacterium]
MKIFEKGCLVQLSVSIWGGRIKLSSSALQVDADPALIKATKYLVDRECLKPVERVRNEARSYLYEKTLPFPIPGVLFIPKELIGKIDERLKAYQTDFNEQAEAFSKNYDFFMQGARLRLNSLYDPADYPADIRSKFSFSWRFLVLDSPGQSGMLTPEIYEREREKFQRTIEEFHDLAGAALRARFAEMVDHVVDRLSGEKKVFRDSLIENIRGFLSDFSQLNINDDQALEAQVNRCRAILDGVDPKTLRSDEWFRGEIAKRMGTVQEQLDAMMINRFKRKIRVPKPNQSETLPVTDGTGDVTELAESTQREAVA